jgi:hypothetical protein
VRKSRSFRMARRSRDQAGCRVRGIATQRANGDGLLFLSSSRCVRHARVDRSKTARTAIACTGRTPRSRSKLRSHHTTRALRGPCASIHECDSPRPDRRGHPATRLVDRARRSRRANAPRCLSTQVPAGTISRSSMSNTSVASGPIFGGASCRTGCRPAVDRHSGRSRDRPSSPRGRCPHRRQLVVLRASVRARRLGGPLTIRRDKDDEIEPGAEAKHRFRVQPIHWRPRRPSSSARCVATRTSRPRCCRGRSP